MKTGNRVDGNRITAVANRCYDLVSSSTSRIEALNLVSHAALNEFGEFFGPDILDDPNEVTINFIELLDQVVFEMEEKDQAPTNARDYIIDDLFSRLRIYLEILKGRDVYRTSLASRLLCYDDTVIVRQYRLYEYIPDFMYEFYNQFNLQKHIIRSLLAFEADELLNFFYQIMKDAHCPEIKCMALLGLKKCNGKFSKWKNLREFDPKIDSVIGYAESFDPLVPSRNALPDDIYRLYFCLGFIEFNYCAITGNDNLEWVLSVLDAVPLFDIEASLFSGIHTSLAGIIMKFNQDMLEKIIENEQWCAAFVRLVDLLPASFFNRITFKIDSVKEPFINAVTDLQTAGKISFDEIDSNILRYLMWAAPKTL